jgi:hypothetical protein
MTAPGRRRLLVRRGIDRVAQPPSRPVSKNQPNERTG